MEKIVINTGDGNSEIYIGEDWKSIFKLIPKKGVVIITDENVFNIYGNYFPDFPSVILNPGEKSKDLRVIGKVTSRMLQAGIDRSGFVLGIGGGVVCDIAGFAASIYMRGIRCGYVSTTLLSQVDASIGGKTGVNLGNTKNILGTFNQPEYVICDPSMLKSLPDVEYFSGLSELIKTALIGNEELFELIENNYDPIVMRDIDFLTMIISLSVRFKASVVTQDEKESGLRRILNFGHTYGHAIEMATSFNHGYAVASGMKLAADFSKEKGYLGESDRKRIMDMLNRFDLLREFRITPGKMNKLIYRDKKRADDQISFVFLRSIGRALVEKVTGEELSEFYKKVFQFNRS